MKGPRGRKQCVYGGCSDCTWWPGSVAVAAFGWSRCLLLLWAIVHVGNNGLGVEAAAKKGEKYLSLPVEQVEFWAVLLGNWRGGPVRLRISCLLCGSRGRSVLVL